MKNTDKHVESPPPPISQKNVTRIMLLLIIVLALLAGYYESRFQVWNTNNMRILRKFNVNSTKELLEKTVEVK